MDVLKPLRVKILAHESTAEPGGNRDTAPRILYLPQNIDLPPNSRRQILLHHDVLSNITVFSPTTKLPPGLRAAPTVSDGGSSVFAIANHTAESVRLQKGWEIGSVDPGELTDTPTNFSGTTIFPVIHYRSDAISNL
ncbi:hypothetical protein GWK47_052680 [Chionoecetes opilio]|uniref:Uncharacterized protein n=1 Tax=Chionoecetes opilio TaxID=41210 RepID=A0A8J4Y009_CHIOP|nr:hypothetical protein GWK47_052680 [Chionoecetes opilio]